MLQGFLLEQGIEPEDLPNPFQLGYSVNPEPYSVCADQPVFFFLFFAPKGALGLIFWEARYQGDPAGCPTPQHAQKKRQAREGRQCLAAAQPAGPLASALRLHSPCGTGESKRCWMQSKERWWDGVGGWPREACPVCAAEMEDDVGQRGLSVQGSLYGATPAPPPAFR